MKTTNTVLTLSEIFSKNSNNICSPKQHLCKSHTGQHFFSHLCLTVLVYFSRSPPALLLLLHLAQYFKVNFKLLSLNKSKEKQKQTPLSGLVVDVFRRAALQGADTARPHGMEMWVTCARRTQDNH